MKNCPIRACRRHSTLVTFLKSMVKCVKKKRKITEIFQMQFLSEGKKQQRNKMKRIYKEQKQNILIQKIMGRTQQ